MRGGAAVVPFPRGQSSASLYSTGSKLTISSQNNLTDFYFTFINFVLFVQFFFIYPVYFYQSLILKATKLFGNFTTQLMQICANYPNNPYFTSTFLFGSIKNIPIYVIVKPVNFPIATNRHRY